MSLVAARGHNNIWTAALSIANNRMSKIRKLRVSGADDIAERFHASLVEDCEEFIRTRKNQPPRLAQALREIYKDDQHA